MYEHNDLICLKIVVCNRKLTGPRQVKESPSALSHWASHSTHTDPLAYSRISLTEMEKSERKSQSDG